MEQRVAVALLDEKWQAVGESREDAKRRVHEAAAAAMQQLLEQ